MLLPRILPGQGAGEGFGRRTSDLGHHGYNGPVEFTLRDYRQDDFQTLWEIDQECFPAGISYSRAELAAYIRHAGSFTLVAEVTDGPDQSLRILGFIVAVLNRRLAGHIITIDVLPRARRLGVGSRMLAAAEQRLRVGKCASVSLETAIDNLNALSFYKRHQYDVVKTIPRYYSNGVDAFVLQKHLLSPARAK